MSESAIRTTCYYFLLSYFEKIDPRPHFRGVIVEGESVHWWPDVVRAIEDGRLVPREMVETPVDWSVMAI